MKSIAYKTVHGAQGDEQKGCCASDGDQNGSAGSVHKDHPPRSLVLCEFCSIFGREPINIPDLEDIVFALNNPI